MISKKNKIRFSAFLLGVGLLFIWISEQLNNSLEKSVIEEFNKTQYTICASVRDRIITELNRISFSLKEIAGFSRFNEILEQNIEELVNEDRQYENSERSAPPKGEWNDELLEHKKINSPLVDGFYYINPRGVVLARMPWKIGRVGAVFLDRPAVKKIVNEKYASLLVTEKVDTIREKIPSIALTYPFIVDGKLILITRAIIHMDQFSKVFLKDFQGYDFSIVNSSGLIIGDTDPTHINRNFNAFHELDELKTISIPLEYESARFQLNMLPHYSILEKHLRHNKAFIYLLFGLLWLLILGALLIHGGKKTIDNELEKRKIMEKELFEKKAYLDNILRSSTDMAIAATDPDFRITYYNPMAEKIFGYTAEDVLGRTVQEMHTKEKVEHARFEDAIEIVKKEGVYNYTVEQEKKGKTRYISSRVSGIFDINNKLIGYVLMARDITERKLSKKNLLKAKEEAERANQVKSDFLANVSHELRTPLTSMIGFPVLIKDFLYKFPNVTQSDIDRVLDCNNRIHGQSNKLLDIINDLIELTTIDSEEFELTELPVSVRQLLELIKSLFERKAAEKGILFKTNCGEQGDILILGDKLRLEQVLQKLAHNAIKFSDGGKIILSAFHRGGKMVFQVRDEGAGMSKEETQVVFDSFYQVDASSTRSQGGLGLGLDLVKKLVAKMNGTISVESTKGKGTIFTIELPYKKFRDRKGVKPISDDKTEPVKGKNILVVEDDEDLQFLVESTLPDNKFSFAENGAKALEILKNKRDFDVIFLDRLMPVMDGDVFMKEMAVKYPGLKIPILMITAAAKKDDVKSAEDIAMDLGFEFRYVTKPYELQGIMRALEELSVV